VWSAEATEFDGFTPLALAAAHSERLRLVTGIVNVYTRGRALLAQSAAALAQASGGRFVLGLGTSSNVIVERWNGIPFERPYHHVRDTLRFLRVALTGEKVTETYDSFEVKGFRLGVRVEQRCQLRRWRPAEQSGGQGGGLGRTKRFEQDLSEPPRPPQVGSHLP